MTMRGPCPKAVRTTALPLALGVALVLAVAFSLPAMEARATEATGETGAAAPAQTAQTGAPAAPAFRHIPPGPLRGAVGKELAIPVARGGDAEGDYAVQAALASGPKAKGATESADISVDGRTVRVVPRQPGVYVIEVRGMREGPVA